MQLLVYTAVVSSRANYIFSVLLPAVGVTNYAVTTDENAFLNSLQPRINYSAKRLSPDEIHVQPIGLLSETTIESQHMHCFEFNGSKAFFETAAGDFPFDLFAASFYLISRYEEYLPHDTDLYGRFAHENSLAFKEGFLNLPLVNLWLLKFAEILRQKFPGLQQEPPSFRFLPTYDIDIAWSYWGKGLARNVAGFFKSLLKLDFAAAAERMRVMFGKSSDPFDSYSFLHRLHSQFLLNPVYFFLLAGRNKAYDKNILPSEPLLQALVRQHAQQYSVGIHPSWQSGDRHALLEQEVKTFEKLTGFAPTKCRQHYIRMTLPETYRRLLVAGITEDYSMGYGSINGFRASWCLPFKWYDLLQEKRTLLTVFPFCFMDANSFYEQHYTSNEALNELKNYLAVTSKVNGLLITIWHNQFLGTDKMFAGWQEVYDEFCQLCSETEAAQ